MLQVKREPRSIITDGQRESLLYEFYQFGIQSANLCPNVHTFRNFRIPNLILGIVRNPRNHEAIVIHSLLNLLLTITHIRKLDFPTIITARVLVLEGDYK